MCTVLSTLQVQKKLLSFVHSRFPFIRHRKSDKVGRDGKPKDLLAVHFHALCQSARAKQGRRGAVGATRGRFHTGCFFIQKPNPVAVH